MSSGCVLLLLHSSRRWSARLPCKSMCVHVCVHVRVCVHRLLLCCNSSSGVLERSQNFFCSCRVVKHKAASQPSRRSK